jgi:hypothetical protein
MGVLMHAVPGTKKGRSIAALLVEVPGIEPVAEIELTCLDARIDYAKQR